MNAHLDQEMKHQVPMEQTEETIEGQKIQIDKELNLKGKVCRKCEVFTKTFGRIALKRISKRREA